MDSINTVTESAHEAVDKIASATHQVADAIGERGLQLRATEDRWIGACRGYLRDHPIKSLGIAAAAGFVLSRLLSGR